MLKKMESIFEKKKEKARSSEKRKFSCHDGRKDKKKRETNFPSTIDKNAFGWRQQKKERKWLRKKKFSDMFMTRKIEIGKFFNEAPSVSFLSLSSRDLIYFFLQIFFHFNSRREKKRLSYVVFHFRWKSISMSCQTCNRLALLMNVCR